MIYAPVLIPTLNRYDHLRRCLESLSRCSWAEYTDVFVALDYPPEQNREKYEDGWRQNRAYLRSLQGGGKHGFKNFYLIERDHNYGIWTSGYESNSAALKAQVVQQYDRYIMMEDDNVVAPAFLEFMDKGLERFENDERVIGLSGYRWYFPFEFEGNTYFREDVNCTPWTYAQWVKKQSARHYDYRYFRQFLNLHTAGSLLRRHEYATLGTLLEYCRRSHTVYNPLVDVDISMIMRLTGAQIVLPAQSLVRNIGLDGSGVTMPTNNTTMQHLYDSVPFYTEPHFDFVGTGYERFAENRRIFLSGIDWQSESHYRRRLLKKFIKFLLVR